MTAVGQASTFVLFLERLQLVELVLFLQSDYLRHFFHMPLTYDILIMDFWQRILFFRKQKVSILNWETVVDLTKYFTFYLQTPRWIDIVALSQSKASISCLKRTRKTTQLILYQETIVCGTATINHSCTFKI